MEPAGKTGNPDEFAATLKSPIWLPGRCNCRATILAVPLESTSLAGTGVKNSTPLIEMLWATAALKLDRSGQLVPAEGLLTAKISEPAYSPEALKRLAPMTKNLLES